VEDSRPGVNRQELENRQEFVGKLGRVLSMLLILVRLSRQATCHLDYRLRLQLADVLRDRGGARPSLPEQSQLPSYAIGPCSQFMKHAREGKVALPQRFYPLFYPLVKIFRHYLSAREFMLWQSHARDALLHGGTVDLFVGPYHPNLRFSAFRAYIGAVRDALFRPRKSRRQLKPSEQNFAIRSAVHGRSKWKPIPPCAVSDSSRPVGATVLQSHLQSDFAWLFDFTRHVGYACFTWPDFLLR
jgi:hypothetical protein